MICNRKLIHYLLILSIGLLPAFSLGAGEPQHMDHASSDCPNCNPVEMAIESGCETESCLVTLQVCGANFFAGFIPQKTVSFGHLPGRIFNYSAGDSGFSSHRAESIYRPPIV